MQYFYEINYLNTLNFCLSINWHQKKFFTLYDFGFQIWVVFDALKRPDGRIRWPQFYEIRILQARLHIFLHSWSNSTVRSLAPGRRRLDKSLWRSFFVKILPLTTYRAYLMVTILWNSNSPCPTTLFPSFMAVLHRQGLSKVYVPIYSFVILWL